MAANTTSACPLPFLNLHEYPNTGGYIGGRFCNTNSTSFTDCCLPCPLEDWTYSDDFTHKTRIASWFTLVGLCTNVFLLLTFALLQSEKSHRHYLNICLCVALILFQLGFFLPIAAKPEKCYNAITPRDMHSSMSCAWSGALLLAGGMGATIWVLLRSLWTHLRICWDYTHSNAYFIVSQIVGWGVVVTFLTACLAVSGVSYRLIPSCIPNQPDSLVDYFAWLLVFGGIAFLLQSATSGYCLWIYARNLWQSDGPSVDDNPAPSHGLPLRRLKLGQGVWNAGREQAWKRVRKSLLLQWRSIALSFLVVTITSFFAGVFTAVNAALSQDTRNTHHAELLETWATCLVLSGGNKNECLPLTKDLIISESTLMAAIMMASLTGIFCTLLLTRSVMFHGWYDLITGRKRNRDSDEFLTVSPKRMSLRTALRSDRIPSSLESPTKASFLPPPSLRLSLTTPESAYQVSSGSGNLRRRSNDAEVGRATSQDADDTEHTPRAF